MDSTDNVNEKHYDGNFEEEKEDLYAEHCFCTFAVTGTNPTFQAIFIVSEDSAGEDQSPLCVCQACAEVCFDDGYHEVEYIGMGPSYCDCSRMGKCKIYEQSLREAERLGIVVPIDQKEIGDSPTESLPQDFIREAFDVPVLQPFESDNSRSSLAPLLVEQAQELIKHTKETHWIDETVVGVDGEGGESGQKKMCLLESLAWSIYRSHRERYKDSMFSDDDNGEISKGGAEWWVQVKEISQSNMPAEDATTADESDTLENSNKTSLASSIDLHYDKDEALAESFGIGSFPTLSTVTYLTASPTIAAPTIVFDHTYTQGEDEVMSSMMVSRPRIGKHICFDGRLLHGAPYHQSLLSSPLSTTNTSNYNQNHEDSREASRKPSYRVTFLVNIWKDRKPASVHVLDDKIRQTIFLLPQYENEIIPPLEQILPMTPLSITRISFDEEETMPENLRDRIELPFVSNLAEDDDDGENNSNHESSMVVVTFPPPSIEDCAIVAFGPGLQAYMDYNYGEPHDVESNAAQTDDESPSHSKTRNPQSDYV